MRPRSYLFAGLGFLVLLVAAFAAYWLWAADRLETAIAEWAQDQRRRGYEIAYRGPTVEGFPVRLTVGVAEPQAAAPDRWRWAGPPLQGEAWLWRPLTITGRFPGWHTVTREENGLAVDAELNADQADAKVVLRGDGQVETVEAALAGITWLDPVIGRVTAGTVTARLGPRRQVADATDADKTAEHLALQGAVTALVLPAQLETPLGREVPLARVTATLEGELPSGPPKDALARWRDAGGKLELHQVALQWGPLELSGEGTVSLDRDLRPLGAFTTRIAGLAETLDALAAAGLIEPQQSFAIELALMALAGQRDAQGRTVVSLPVSFQGGRLYLGPVPLLRLDPVL